MANLKYASSLELIDTSGETRMPSRFRLRKIFAPVVKGIATPLARWGITPNGATWLMLICATLSATILISTRNLLVFGIFIFITGLMDGVDGAIARLTNRQSKFGGFFDSTMDRVSEGIIYTALLIVEAEVLVFTNIINILLIGLSLIFSFLISYTRARLDLSLLGEQKVDSNIGLLGRSERLFFLFILSVISYFSTIFVFSWGFVLYTFSVMGTALFRIICYKDYLTRAEVE